MRAREFMIEAESASTYNLMDQLEILQNETDQIRVDSLVNLVRRKPGSEMFNVDILLDEFENNPEIKNFIDDIRTDESGVKYVYLTPLEKDLDQKDQALEPGSDKDLTPDLGPEKTVDRMSKRAMLRRIG